MSSNFQKKADGSINNQDISPEKATSLNVLAEKRKKKKKDILLDLILESLFDTKQSSWDLHRKALLSSGDVHSCMGEACVSFAERL